MSKHCLDGGRVPHDGSVHVDVIPLLKYPGDVNRDELQRDSIFDIILSQIDFSRFNAAPNISDPNAPLGETPITLSL